MDTLSKIKNYKNVGRPIAIVILFQISCLAIADNYTQKNSFPQLQMESSIVRFNTLVGVSLDFTYVNTNSKIRIRLPYANNIFLNIYSQLVGRHSIDYSYSKLGIQSKTCCWGIVPYASLGREDAFLTYANFVAVGIDIRLWEHYRISLETMQKWVFPNLTNSSSSQKGISWSFAFLAF